MKQKVNVKNIFEDKNAERRTGVRDIGTNMVKTSNGMEIPLSHYESIDPNGVGFFETREKGEIIQKSGKFTN